MRLRIVIPGLLAGALGGLAIEQSAYRWFSTELMVSWPLPTWAASEYAEILQMALYMLVCLMLFIAGWSAARWDWAENWRESLLAGAGAGLIAGCIIYNYSAGVWSGVAGQKQILQNFYTPVNEDEGILLLSWAIYGAGWHVYRAFVICATTATALGGLGGLLSVMEGDGWGLRPAKGPEWLHRIPAYSLTTTAILTAVVVIAALSMLPNLVSEAVSKINADNIHIETNANWKFLGLIIPYWICYVMITMPLLMTIGWMLRNWKTDSVTRRILTPLWILISGGIGYVLQGNGLFELVRNLLEIFEPDLLTTFLALIALAAPPLVGLAFGLLKNPPALLPERDISKGDWLGYALTQGILGSTQLMAGLVVFMLSLTLIAVENIPHLTNQGIVTNSPVAQIQALRNLLISVSRWLMLASAILALVLAGIVRFVRWVFAPDPAEP